IFDSRACILGEESRSELGDGQLFRRFGNADLFARHPRFDFEQEPARIRLARLVAGSLFSSAVDIAISYVPADESAALVVPGAVPHGSAAPNGRPVAPPWSPRGM